MTFRQEKGKVVARMGGNGCSITVHERTPKDYLMWLNEAFDRYEADPPAKPHRLVEVGG